MFSLLSPSNLIYYHQHHIVFQRIISVTRGQIYTPKLIINTFIFIFILLHLYIKSVTGFPLYETGPIIVVIIIII
jgi:hypothetical protein